MSEDVVKRNCINCWNAGGAHATAFGYGKPVVYCRFKGYMIHEWWADCRSAITDHDVKTSRGLFAFYVPGLSRYKFKSDVAPGELRPPSAPETDHSMMQTFLCENCGESVQVCEDSVGRKVHWKCMVCHQQNCFEVAQE